MAFARQIPRPTRSSIIRTLFVLVGVAAAMVLIALFLAKLGILQTAALVGGYFAGAIFGQAREVANQREFSGDLLGDLRTFFVAAWSDEYSAAFIFRAFEWGGFLVAATLLAKLLTGETCP